MVRIPRICLVLGLSLVLLAATVPAAHARTLSKPLSSNSIIGSWIDATLAWVTHFVTGAPQGQQHGSVPGSKLTYSSGTDTSGYAQPMTGSCIDPGGRPSSCTGL